MRTINKIIAILTRTAGVVFIAMALTGSIHFVEMPMFEGTLFKNWGFFYIAGTVFIAISVWAELPVAQAEKKVKK